MIENITIGLLVMAGWAAIHLAIQVLTDLLFER